MDQLKGWENPEVDLREVPGGEGFPLVGIIVLMALNSMAWGIIGYLAGRLL